MPFGLCNAPSMFESLMDAVLEGLLGDRCLLYLDDIIVFSHTFSLCGDQLESVLGRLLGAGLRVKPTKCRLLRRVVAFLGHIVFREGIVTDPYKIAAMLK